MACTQLLSLIAELADANRRLSAAKDLAQHLGAEDLIVFIKDSEVGNLLPAPGFPQTLPGGRVWREFLSQCASSGSHSGKLPFSDVHTPKKSLGVAKDQETVLVFVGGKPRPDALAEIRLLLPLIGAAFQGERAALTAAGQASAAREAVLCAEALTSMLDATRRELEDALFAADKEIARREQAEQLASEQREWLRVTLGSIGDAVMTTDTDGRVTYLNPVAESLTGWTQEEATGQPLETVFTIVNEHSRQPVENPVEKVLREGVTVGLANHTILIVKGGGERPIDDSAAPIRDQAGVVIGVVLVFRDVTERKVLEDNLRQSAADLSEADRRKDEFLATLAHELRNPLAPIRTALELMRMSGDDRTLIKEARPMMERQVQQLVRLVDDLLEVSRITSGKVTLRKERVELAAVVQSAVEATRSVIEEARHELTVALPPQPVLLEADPARLTQILSNLLTNAARYTPDGGRIWLTAERYGGDVVVTVKDTGVGIPAEMVDRVFEMFAQVDRSLERSQGGLGIGLTLVKRLVEMHAGSVQAHSEGPDQGSEFTIRLPILIDQGQERQQTHEENRTEPGKFRVLAVDDNQDAAKMLGMMLKALGNEVRTAKDGLEALDVAAEFRPEIVLMDIGMPRLSGYDAARRMRNEPWGKNIFLVALTGWGQEEDRQRTKEAGFDHHIVKPIEPATLRKLLANRPSSK